MDFCCSGGRECLLSVVEFTVNRDLSLREWSGCAQRFEGQTAEGILGHPYFENFPRIHGETGDAIAEAMAVGRFSRLERRPFPCFFGKVEAAVEIDPVYDETVVVGARVRMDLFAECHFSDNLKQVRHLADIGKTASILSHGVRNPLNAIKGAVVYLKSRYSADADLLEFTGIMEDEIDRLDKFISEFLSTSFSSFEQNPHDINALLKKIEMFVTLQAKTAGVSLVFPCGQVPLVSLNVFQVEHAILNILNNAIHALAEGGQVVVASRCERRSGKRFVIVEITDNGPGMPKPPAEEDGPLKTGSSWSEGKGFGLFIAREILQHHGGSLEIQSHQGAGTRVRLLLPVCVEES
jgi:two-component system, NtrC family, nitrogen regulation sensor histidine kinase GlnL